MDLSNVSDRLAEKEEGLSPYASKVRNSRGRDVPEEPPAVRTEFQRDRDRIVHAHAFRRLKHKTQVFIAPLGDHYVTRLTHTLEVTQIARTISRALNLNEDLVEAMALGHDLGHTPFGHVGEDLLNDLFPGGFRHNRQSLRVVELLEKNGEGLNLTYEVRQGILAHSKPRGDFLKDKPKEGLTLEAQICRLADAVAYLNHDIGDAIRAGLLTNEELPPVVRESLGKSHSQRIDAMVRDVIAASWAATGEGEISDDDIVITMSPTVREAIMNLREFMFEKVYGPVSNGADAQQAKIVLEFLYATLRDNPRQIPQEYWVRAESVDRVVVDYLSGMTDGYALRLAEEFHPGIVGDSLRWRV